MDSSKQFLKLPNAGKKLLLDYVKNKKKDTLLKGVLENIATQKTMKSKSVRRSVFRGLMRNFLSFSNVDMVLIEATQEQQQAYSDSITKALKKQRENIIDKSLLTNIFNTDMLMALLITSGLRVQELLSGDSKFEDGKIFFKLEKKEGDAWYEIFPLVSAKKWWLRYQNMKVDKASLAVKGQIDILNRRLHKVIPEDFYKRSSHIARAIYARYMYRFRNPENLTLSNVISLALNHENQDASTHYGYIKFADDVVDDIRI